MPQPNYPFRFIQADALAMAHMRAFGLIWAIIHHLTEGAIILSQAPTGRRRIFLRTKCNRVGFRERTRAPNPTSQEFVLNPFVEKIAVRKISVDPKSAVGLISDRSSPNVGSCYFNQRIVGPNPNRPFFKNQPPGGDVNIWRDLWQRGSCEFFDAEFKQRQRGTTFILDAESDAAVWLKWSGWKRIGNDSFPRYLTILNDIKSNNERQREFDSHHYVRLAKSSVSSSAGYAPQKACRNADDRGENETSQSVERDGISRSPLPEGFALFCFSAALFSGFLTFLFFYLCGGIG